MSDHVVFDTKLARTLGLDEAVLYAVLKQVAYPEKSAQVNFKELTPWWDAQTLEALLMRLRRNKLIHYEILRPEFSYKILAADSDSQPTPLPTKPASAPTPNTAARAVPPTKKPSPQRKPANNLYSSNVPVALDEHWTPPQSSQHYLLTVVGISPNELQEWLPEFIRQHLDVEPRNTSQWRKTYDSWMTSRLRRREAERERNLNARHMDGDWQPDQITIKELLEQGIAESFINEELPKFRIYWNNRGIAEIHWNTRFYKHVAERWQLLLNNMKRDMLARLIDADWEPGAMCMDLIQQRGIDDAFTRSLLGEFRMYWMDKGVEHPSWDTVFFRWVNMCWGSRNQKRHKLEDTNFTDRLLDLNW